jgi:uncharacterized protein
MGIGDRIRELEEEMSRT